MICSEAKGTGSPRCPRDGNAAVRRFIRLTFRLSGYTMRERITTAAAYRRPRRCR